MFQPLKPTVATITATYNRARLLERAIKSCQNQTYPVQEIIIVDDGSTDKTTELVARLAAQDSRIRYLRLPENRGEQYALIEGIKMSGSDWVAFADSDDELLPHSIEARLSAANQSDFMPGLVFGDIYFRSSEKDKSIEGNYERLAGYVYPKLFRKLGICLSSTMMMRRECFPVSGFPHPNWPHYQDRAMVFTIAKHFPILHCGDFVAIMYSDAGDRLSDSEAKAQQGLAVWIRTYTGEILRYQGPLGLFFWWTFWIHVHLRFYRRRMRLRFAPSRLAIKYLYIRFLDYLVAAFKRLLALYFKDPF